MSGDGLRGIWAGRGHVSSDFWRLYFVVVVEGEAVGMQDVVGVEFATHASATTFSWLSPEMRGSGLGREMRSAALHLAFHGLFARESTSEAFTDNEASNSVSQSLGYEPNGTSWATRRGEPALLQRWRLTRAKWEPHRRDDIHLEDVEAALPALQIQQRPTVDQNAL
ncbi:MAG: GNAT family protein [Ilumatobacteraceae bacterium]